MPVPRRLRKKSKLKVFVDACDLVEYVLKITANEKVFKPEQSAVTDKVKTAAIDIARFIWCANNIRVRQDAQLYAERRAVYWTGMAVDLREEIAAWRASDAKRYGRL